jgi:hypothetical protein
MLMDILIAVAIVWFLTSVAVLWLSVHRGAHRR